jgi:small conductance mechanosensitive channel
MKLSWFRFALLLATLIALTLTVPTLDASTEAPPETPVPAMEEPKDPLVQEAEDLVANIRENRQKTADVKSKLAAVSDEERVILRRQIADRQLLVISDVHALNKNVMKQEKKGLDASAFRQQAESMLKNTTSLIIRQIEELQRAIRKQRDERESLTPEQLVPFEEMFIQTTVRLDQRTNTLSDHVDQMEEMGLDASEETSYLSKILSNRAEILAGQIKLSLEEIKASKTLAKENPDNAEYMASLRAAEAKLKRTTQSLQATVDVMKKTDLESAQYKQLLVQTTGDITGDIFEAEVALGLLQQWIDNGKTWAVNNGPRLTFKVLLFLFILVVFRILGRFTGKVVRMSMAASKLEFSQLLHNTFVSVATNLVFIFGLLVALSQVGFEIAPLLAGLGVAGFIVGFALQDTLGNFASGMMILIYRPYDVGDLIDAAGVSGKVSDMSLVCTTIFTFDNQRLIVPNSKIWGDVIKNVTAQKVRRVDMVFGISYSDDIPHAEEVMMAILKEHEKVLKDPEPVVKLHTLGESSVDFVVRPWVHTVDYWDVYWDITREVKMRFDREGIAIPFPQRDVHFYMEKSVEAEAKEPV